MLDETEKEREKHMGLGNRTKNRTWIITKTVIFGEDFKLLPSVTRRITSHVTNFTMLELIGLVGRQTTLLAA
jgi:hypothetical protein